MNIVLGGLRSTGLWSCNRHIFRDEEFTAPMPIDSSLRAEVETSVSTTQVKTWLSVQNEELIQARTSKDSSWEKDREEGMIQYLKYGTWEYDLCAGVDKEQNLMFVRPVRE
ncbi:hypothetical protein ABEB36_013688 [Hypothenemus hampei]|uniref:Uncharacterized protein n=1 Tax=Hypothenemus hampei TaxID=57062 RepID=A0ABD1E4Z8_HYPHA